MAKFDYRALKPKEQRQLHSELVKIIRQSRKKDLDLFLSKLLTPSESVMLGRRVMIARYLLKGYSYLDIRKKMKVGLTTIRVVDRWLQSDFPKYQEIRHYYRHNRPRADKRAARSASTIPGTLDHTIQHDSRYILVRLLLGM